MPQDNFRSKNLNLPFIAPAQAMKHVTVNKAASADTGWLVYQTEFSGRAEMGLTGDDDFHIKVSPDGTTWHEALVVDGATGLCRTEKSPLKRICPAIK